MAVLSLLLSGMLSLALVVGRMPGICDLFTDPLFFKRGLVAHVDLALIVWFDALLVALIFLLPSRRRVGRLSQLGPFVALLGMLAFVAAAAMPGAEPILSNYVPAIDHPLFAFGICTFGLGVLMAVLDRRLLPSEEIPSGFFPIPPSARVGIRAAVLLLLLAALTFGCSVLVTPTGLTAHGYYELVAWGGGHVMQFASVAGMITVWLILLGLAIGEDPIDRRIATWLFAVLVIPATAAPWLALQGTTSGENHAAFTTMMRWGIFPVTSLFLLLGLRALWRARREGATEIGKDPRVLAFGASAALAVLGFVLGALIRGPNTMIPAHYHASIGAVTVAYMAIVYPLLGHLEMRLPTTRIRPLIRWQPALFGLGQAIFALGFGVAGHGGMGRKAYGTEQVVRSLSDYLGLGVMGLGGLIAAAAGLLFLWVVIKAWAGGEAPARGEIEWTSESIRSNG
ncbi:MAG: hypothetical protein OEY14_03095 [Myxococcales bacterium]|nr:hypothetical protein [Myxococcales bacterium]